MMEWVEGETTEETADGSIFFSSPQTFGELCSNVTLFICLRISGCQIAKDAPRAAQCFSRKQSGSDAATGQSEALTFH